jgi:hypothetical protein
MNEILPFHGVTLATAGRPDIRAMMQHFTAPYRAAVPFQDLIQTVQLNSTPARRSSNQRPSAAIAIRNAVAGHIDEVVRARDRLSVAMLAPDEEDVRAVIAAMMMVFPAPPTETSSFFVDALVMELREPDVGDRCPRRHRSRSSWHPSGSIGGGSRRCSSNSATSSKRANGPMT